MLAVAATAIAALCALFLSSHLAVFVALACAQVMFWSTLLPSSGAYAVRLIPSRDAARLRDVPRHGHDPGHLACPGLGFLLFGLGWRWLTAVLLGDRCGDRSTRAAYFVGGDAEIPARGLAPPAERLAKTMLKFAVGLLLVSLGYSGLTTSSRSTPSTTVAPRGLFFVAFAGTILGFQPFVGAR